MEMYTTINTFNGKAEYQVISHT